MTMWNELTNNTKPPLNTWVLVRLNDGSYATAIFREIFISDNNLHGRQVVAWKLIDSDEIVLTPAKNKESLWQKFNSFLKFIK